jgi:hypothetical protein
MCGSFILGGWVGWRQFGGSCPAATQGFALVGLPLRIGLLTERGVLTEGLKGLNSGGMDNSGMILVAIKADGTEL